MDRFGSHKCPIDHRSLVEAAPGIIEGMRAGTVTYRKTLAGVVAVLSDVDPLGLEPGSPDGAPSDEYEMEAVDLVRILLKAGAVTSHDVEEVWMRWFSESLVLRLGPPRMAQLIDRLNELVDDAR
jgi:hypothetical protein